MIQAGDLIDGSLGVTFGLSTLTAAAIGQIFSDVSGVCFGSTVDALFAKVGLESAGLTVAQAQLRHVKLLSTGSAAVGVTIGCLLGMTSLLFMDLGKTERLKRERELSTLFSTLLEDGHTLVSAERCTLFLVDNHHFLFSKVSPASR